MVTALFCDLVGFTAASESADPEDVNAMLGGYFAVARAAIERFGGTVEKFIGDAVVGVFGVPTVHEDDPERAVRAGLAIAEDAERLTGVDGSPLQLRVGVNTGEALVRLDRVATSGEGFMTGDAINTASRIQSVAPEGGVAVGQATFDATKLVFDYEELPPASVKGKTDPVAVFHAKAPLARFGTDLTRTHDSPFVGREIDLALLKGIFDKTIAAASPQLVTVVGEPGLGKSRIVAELFNHVDARSELVTWRQGRCLPYGEGITFWALGEVVKAHAGILESDDPATAIAKLDAVLPEGEERAWFRQRIVPLLGIEASSTAERQELFTAWRRFLEHVAEQDPTVIVFEDLHWADEAMLAFIEHLADRAEAVSLLIVGTARPELFEQHPNYAAGLRNATPINLAPLSEAETARLVSGLLEATVLPAEVQATILDRVGGNPLYVEEFVRLLKDRDLIVPKGGSWELRPGAQVPFPDSVQALIAARLDTLSAEAKSLLADAAVVGKVFWAGAVAAMSGREVAEVVEALRELSRKELLRPSRQSSMAGETEYSFWHVLTRDVAYSQLPRASRADRHVAAAKWLEATAAERVEDLSAVLAYHYSAALELLRAAGHPDRAGQLETPARVYLTRAGERALNLDVGAALSYFEQALLLAPPKHPARPVLQLQLATVLEDEGRDTDAIELLEEAIDALQARGDHGAVGIAMIRLAWVLVSSPEQVEHGYALIESGLASLDAQEPSEDLCRALVIAARLFGDGADVDHLDRKRQALLLDRALAMSEELGLQALRIDVMVHRRVAMLDNFETDGSAVRTMRSDLAWAIATGASRSAATLYQGLAFWTRVGEGPHAAIELAREGLVFARRRGMQVREDGIRLWLALALLAAGRWTEVIDEADTLIEKGASSKDAWLQATAMLTKSNVLSLTGSVEEADALSQWDEQALGEPHPDPIYLAVVPKARTLRHQGSIGGATELLADWIQNIETKDGYRDPYFPLHLAREAIAVGRIDLARQCTGLPGFAWAVQAPAVAASIQATVAEAEERPGEALASFKTATGAWNELADPYETALGYLGQGRCMITLDNPAAAVPLLRQARISFSQLGATPALTETDTLLGRATALSS